MAKGFNLTAELNLRGPANVRQVVSNINKQLKNIKGTVNLTIDPNSAKSIAQVNKNLVQLQKNLNNVRSSARAVSSNLSGIGKQFNNISTAATKAATTTQNAAKNINSVGQQSQAAANQIGKAGTLMESFGKQSALAVKRFAAFSLVTSTVFSLTNAINQAFKQFVEFDRQLVRLQQVTGKTAAGLKGISQEISNLSQSLGVSSSDLISVSTTLAQAGLSARETEKALKALALSALAPSFDDLNRTVEGSIALMRQFGISAGDLEKALGSVNAVAANFAVEAGDIIAAIQRTGGVFAAASRGVSEGTDALNEFVAVFTSVRATTRESAETIATGLRTIFTRIQRGSTIDALREFGVELQDAEGKFVGAYKAIQLLSQGLNQLDPRDVKFSTLVEELGGFRQIGKVIPLIQQFATAQQALAVAQRGQGSLAEDAATAQLSLANQIAKVREEFLDLIREIGGTDSFKAITKGALDLASALIQIADSVKGVLPVLGVLLAGKGLKAGFGFTKGFLGGLKGQADGGLIKPYASGGMVDVALMPGETVISPKLAKKIGMSTLDRMNKADKMASGGLAKVPGSGRRDSFYTQLEEGSYVIRTDATKAMGDGTIKDIASGRRKFADGGNVKFVKRFEYGGNVDEIKIAGTGKINKSVLTQLSPKQAQQLLKTYETRPLQNQQVDVLSALRNRINERTIAANKTKAAAKPKDTDEKQSDSATYPKTFGLVGLRGTRFNKKVKTSDNRKVTLVGGTLPPGVGDKYEGKMTDEFVGTVRDIAKSLAQEVKGVSVAPDDQIRGTLGKTGFYNAVGSYLETALAAVGAPFVKDSTNAPIDFPAGLGAVAKKFKIARNIPTDATRTVGDSKALGQRGKSIAKFKGQVERYLQKFYPKNKKQAMASGGEVPIMAQEGEYVINKKSARSIGYGNLNRLNKYHDGGMVQKFKFGGDVQKLANGGPTVSQQLGSLGLPSGISGKLKSAFERLIDESRGLISGFSATEAQMYEYNASMRMIERASKPLADSIRLNNNLNQRTGRQQIRIAKEVERQIASIMNSNTHTTTYAQRLAKLNRQIVKKVAIIDQENARVAKTGTLYSKIDAVYEKLKASVAKLTASTKRAATRMLGMNMPSDPAWRQKGLSGKPVRGGGGVGMGGGTTAIAIALPLLADAFSSNAEATDAATASTQAFVQSLTTTAGVGLLVSDTLGDMAGKIPGVGAALGPLVTGIGLAATAAFSIAKAYADASEAARKFTIEDSRKKIESESEKLAEILEDIAKTGSILPATMVALDRSVEQSTQAALNAAKAMNSQYRASVVQNTVEYSGNGDDRGVINRSIILQEKGTAAYFRSLMSVNAELSYMTDLLPKLAKESSTIFKEQAKNIENVLVEKLKSGASIEDLMSADAWDKQSEVLARSNAEIEQMILAIDSNTNLSEAEKEARRKNIITLEASRIAQEKVKQVQLEKNLADLANASNKLVYSFNRILSNMEDSIARANTELNKLENSASDLRSSLSGQASSAGTPQLDRLISVLESPRGFTSAERSGSFAAATQGFGASSGNISKILEVGATLEDTVLKTINRISANAAPGTTNEAIGAQVSTAISKQLANIGLPPELSNKLAKEIGNQVSKLRTSGDDQIDFSEIVEQVPGLGKALDSVKTATNAVTSNLKFLQTAFQKLSASTNTLIELQIDSNNRFLRSQQIIIDGYANLAQALGKNLSLAQKRYAIESQITARTGGTTDPTQIRRNITGLSNQKQNLEEGKAAAQAAQDTDAVLEFERQIQKTSVSLNENVAALQNMAENTDLASAALSTLQQAQEKQRAGIGIIEKLVTSTPKQLNELNNSAIRLSRNMAGGLNFGASPEQRQQDLELFNMIAPLLGDQAEPLKANVLQSMLQQSGVGITPMFQQILDTMRNPQADPVQAQAIKTYNEAIQKQSDANTQLALINQNLANDISQKTGAAVAAAIAQTTVRFDEAQLKDILSGTNRPDLDRPLPAPGRATGGLIYKAVGGNVANTVFKPKGTDTVPAMLTPGEFVVNRDSTRKNLPLLKSINSGKSSSTRYYAAGGLVSPNLKQKDTDQEKAEEKASRVKVSDKDYHLINDDLVNSAQFSDLFAAQADYYPVYGADLDITKKMRDRINNAGFLDDIPVLSSLASYFVQLKAAGIVKDLTFDLTKGVKHWEAGKPKRIEKVYRPGDQTWWERINESIAGRAGSNAMLGNRQAALYYPVFEYFGRSATGTRGATQKKFISGLPGTIADLKNGMIADVFKGSGKLNTSVIEQNDYKYSDKDYDDSRSLATQSAVANELYKYLDQFQNQSLDTSQFVDGGKLAPGDTDFRYKSNLSNYSLTDQSVKSVIDTISKPVDKYFSLSAIPSGSNLRPLDLIDTNVKTLHPTEDGSLKISEQGSAYQVSQTASKYNVEPSSVNGIIQSVLENKSKLLNHIKLLNELKNNKASYFNTLSSAIIDVNKQDAVLESLFSGTLPGLYKVIKNNLLSEQFKGAANLGTEDLAVFNSNLKDSWNDRVTNFLPKPIDFSIYQGASPFKVTKDNTTTKEFPWVQEGKAQEIIDKYFRGEAETAKREAIENSKFVLGQKTEASVRLNTAKIFGDEFPDKDLNLAYAYKTIDMPKYSKTTGYTKPEAENIKGVVAAMSTKSGLYDVNPFIASDESKSLIGAGEIFFPDQNALEQSLKKYYNNDIAAKYDKKQKILNNEQPYNPSSVGAFMLKKIQDEAMAQIDPSGNARELEPLSQPFYISDTLLRLKDKILSQVGSEISRGETADLVKDAGGKSVFDSLETAQSIVKAVVGPVTGALRYAGIAFPNISDIANLAEYGAGLIRAGDTVGGFARSGRDNFANAYGQLKSLGEIFSAFGSGNEAFGLAKLGISEYTPDRRGNISPINIENARSAASAIRDYGRFLTEQGALFMGGNAAAVDQTVDSNLTVGDQTIADIFKSGKVQLAEVDAQAGTFSSSQASEAQAPKTFKDIGKMVLNPYSVFPGETRKNLTTPLNNVLSQNGYQRIVPLIQGITEHLTLQDKFLSDPNNAINPAENADLNKLNRDLLLLTGGVLGAIPNKDKLDQLKAARSQQQKAMQPQTRARGGLIYAANGTLVNFQPQGTDTVPAMLTPGEFVINRKATQKHLPLLKAINNSGPSGVSAGDMVQKFAYGGVVQPKYYADAGRVTANNRVSSAKPVQAEINKQSISSARTAISEALTTGATAVASVLESISLSENSISAIASFTNSVRDIINGLSGISIPSQIQFTGNVQVNLTGATGLTQAAESIVDSAIKKAFGDLGLANEGSIVIPQRYK
jgi:TP901 family phage tail tape measure protein